MSEFGMMGVDWEERVNFDRLRREQIELHQQSYNTLFNACAEAVVGNTNGDIGKHLNQVFVGEQAPDIFTTMSFDERLLRDVHPLDKTTGRKIRRPE